MQIKKSSPTHLTLADQPGCFWLFGLFFLLIGGVVVAGLLGLFTNLKEVSLPEKAFAWVLALSAIGVGAYIAYDSPGSRVSFDRQKGSVVIRRKGLMRKQTLQYSLLEVETIFLREGQDIDGDPVYRLTMRLRSGEEVELSWLWLHGKDKLEKVAERARLYLEENPE